MRMYMALEFQVHARAARPQVFTAVSGAGGIVPATASKLVSVARAESRSACAQEPRGRPRAEVEPRLSYLRTNVLTYLLSGRPPASK